jgi:hypothetical protein
MEALLAGIQANSFILLMTGIGAVLFILFQKIEKVETRLFIETKELKNDVVRLMSELLKVKNEVSEFKHEVKNELRELISVVKLLNKKD